MIQIDGSLGEGGGQVLRSALSLSMLTGTPFHLDHIRAGRAKPGLLRQHLTSVRAAAAVCGAGVEGDTLGSTTLTFHPGPVRGGEHHFEIGSAGSASLVLQTVLIPLLQADTPSTIRVEGGTHNLAAPPFHFLDATFMPCLREMGADVDLSLVRWGFYPAGGGEVRAEIRPGALGPLERVNRGAIHDVHVHAAVSATPARVGHRALGVLKHALNLDREAVHFHEVTNPVGPGLVVWIEARFDGGVEVITSFAGRRFAPEGMAYEALEAYRAWEALDVPVGEHLADQLLLPLALGGGRFRTGPITPHTETNAAIIERFLPVRFTFGEVISVER